VSRLEPTESPARSFWPVAAGAAVVVHLAACLVSYGGLLSASRPGDTVHYREFATEIVDRGLVPYRDFYVEFPPGALAAFVAPELLGADHYFLLFKLLMATCGALTLVLAARSLAALGATRRRYLSLIPFALLPLLLGHVYLNRYDAVPALLLVATLMLLLLGRGSSAGAALGLAVAAKLLPAVVLPVAGIRIFRDRGRRAMLWALAAFTGVLLAAFLPFTAIAPGGVEYSLRTQAERHLQLESIGASVLLGLDRLGVYDSHWILGAPGSLDLGGGLPDAVGAFSSLAQLAAIALVAVVYWRGPEVDERLVTAFAAAVTVIALGKVLSPQYLTMLAAVVPLAGGRSGRRASVLLVVALILSQGLSTWGGYHDLRNAGSSVFVLLIRNACLLTLFALLVASLHRSRTQERSPH
jgi:hypothetical protein